MVNNMVLILILLVCVSGVYAYDPEITQLAKLISKHSPDKQTTVLFIDNFVNEIIEYKFYYHAKGIDRTWGEKEGDCTDISMLKQFMLYKANIKSRLVHGYDIDGNKHDWYEYKISNKWQSIELNNRKVGLGTW